MENKHKGMTLHGIWLSKAEELSLIESLKLIKEKNPLRMNGENNIVEIIETANDRGDFFKNEQRRNN